MQNKIHLNTSMKSSVTTTKLPTQNSPFTIY